MEVKGKVIAIAEVESGQSQKGEWKKQTFAIITDDKYPKKIAFEVWNDKLPMPVIGEECTVHFNAESREHNGKWYTGLTAWKIEQEAPAVPVDDLPPTDDLPF